MTPYSDTIRQCLATSGHVGQYDPLHIEAYMRLEHSTLDHLSPSQFADEVKWARLAVATTSTTDMVRLVDSLGL